MGPIPRFRIRERGDGHILAMECTGGFPQIQRHAYRIIAFDWDGTAVRNRRADARPVARVLERLLKHNVSIVVVTGTNFDNIDNQFCSLITGPHKRGLFVCCNRGSEVFGFNSRSEPVLIYRRQASEIESTQLSRVAEAVKQAIEDESNIDINIIYQRLNRRKIDLIPEWEDPPKSRIGQLLEATQRRLVEGGFAAGIKGAYELAAKYSLENGLTDASITSDVKHIEVGLTDKSDSLRWITEELARRRNVGFADILVLGDEFGPIAGFEGSDFRMVLPDIQGIPYVSVGQEPNGVPSGVVRLGGGPSCFLHLMTEQLHLHEIIDPTEDPTFLLIETGYDRLREREIESLLALGNGYLGTRGSLEEQEKPSAPATLVAGVYDRAGPRAIEELVVFPDWRYTQVYVKGEKLTLARAGFIEHIRILDMKKGLLFREWRHRSAKNLVTSIKFLDFTSLADPHTLVESVTVLPENHEFPLKVRAGLKLCNDYEPALQITKLAPELDGQASVIRGKTRFTSIGMIIAQKTVTLPGFVPLKCRSQADETGVYDDWSWNGRTGQEVTVQKFTTLFTSRDGRLTETAVRRRLRELETEGFVSLVMEHVSVWEARWRNAAIRVRGDTEAQRWINFACYHLISAGNPQDDRSSIGARALTGTVYKGHIFWDSEMFILPFFVFTHPPTARAMLMYRYHTLPAAREKARNAGYEGALYAWESGINGEEMTPEYAMAPDGEVIPILSGKLEQHIDAAIAHGIWTYWQATRDVDFMLRAGAEILIETARFWASRVTKKGREYHIYDVEGPDEFHEGVDDNIYTNLMAAWNLRRAADIVRHMQDAHPAELALLSERVGFEPSETRKWLRIADNMYNGLVPASNFIEQFAGYYDLEDIDVRKYEPRTAALDIIMGRERTAASRMVKQADLVMLLYLLEDRFTEYQIRDNFEYYERRTAHSSSLSPCIYGLVAARLGMMNTAMRYFHNAGQIDMADNMGNATGGVHAAALGGLWQQVIMGFAGLRATDDGIFVYPQLPVRWRRLSFSLLWRDVHLDFDIRRGKQIRLNIVGEGEVRAGIYGNALQDLQAGCTYVSEWKSRAWGEFYRQE